MNALLLYFCLVPQLSFMWLRVEGEIFVYTQLYSPHHIHSQSSEGFIPGHIPEQGTSAMEFQSRHANEMGSR